MSETLSERARSRVYQKQLGAYYTSHDLSGLLTGIVFGHYEDELISALSRFIDDDKREQAEQTVRAFLELKVCDPMVGDGVFLRRAADEILRVRQTVGALLSRRHYTLEDPTLKSLFESDQSGFRSYVVQKMLYGVDIDPVLIQQVAKAFGVEGSRIDSNLKTGDSLAHSVSFDTMHKASSYFSAEIAHLIKVRRGGVADKRVSESANVIRKWTLEERGLDDDPMVFSWTTEFPEIFFNDDGSVKVLPGFNIVIGNPPWEVVKPNDREFFSLYHPGFAALSRSQRESIKDELLTTADVSEKYTTYVRRIRDFSNYVRQGGFKFQTGDGVPSGDINLYKLGVEQFYSLTRNGGWTGIVTPVGLATDAGTKPLRRMIFEKCDLREVWGFSSSAKLFERTDVSPAITVFRKDGPTREFTCATGLLSVEDVSELRGGKGISQNPDLVRSISPLTWSIPSIRDPEDRAFLLAIHSHHALGSVIKGKWNVRISRGIDETNDRYMLRTHDTGIPFVKGANLFPFHLDNPTLWVDRKLFAPKAKDIEVDRVAWRDVARPNLRRRLFAALVPRGNAMGNSLNYLVLGEPEDVRYYLIGVLNSLIMDYRVRLTTSNSHINQFVIAQLPVPRLSDGLLFRAIARISRNLHRQSEHREIFREEEGELNALVAKAYGLPESLLKRVLEYYDWLPETRKDEILKEFYVLPG